MSGENPTVLRMRLGAELRELRSRAGLSLEAASKQLRESDVDISASKLSRLENGDGAIKLSDIRALTDAYAVEPAAQRELLIQMAREARAAGNSAWWTDYESVLPSGLSTYVALEANASRLLAFSHSLIDGLLQTEAYACAMIQASQPAESAERISRLVELRMQRQRALREDPRLELMTVMDEAALRRPIGGRAAMKAQMRHIVDVCTELPNVSVQVVPLSKGAYIGQHGLFTLVEPREVGAGTQPVVYVDSVIGSLSFHRPSQIQQFRDMFGQLQAVALDPQESLQVVRRAAEEK